MTRSHSRLPFALLVAMTVAVVVPAALVACEPPAYVAPATLPPCPRVIGSIYKPAGAQSAASEPSGSSESASVVAAASAAPPASVELARKAYQPAPRPPRATAPVASCGDKKNPCPLQRWMREKMAPALAANDAPALAAALDRMARFSPSPGPEWKTMSESAAAAARAGDVAGARKSCQGCHNAFKAQYKEKLRTRPVVPW